MDSFKRYKLLPYLLVLLYSNINLADTIEITSAKDISPVTGNFKVIETELDEPAEIEPVVIEPAASQAIETKEDESEVVFKECERIANKLFSLKLAECQQLALTKSGAFSNQQAPLLIKEYPPLGDREPQARILMLGGIHGDEYSSVTIMFRWMQTLDQYHSGLFHWKVTPLVNPDGLLQKSSQRMNANGVDLNRNFDNGVNETASLDYWEKRTYEDPRRYPGETPMSEPETRWIKQLIDEFKPDAIVAVHAPYGIVDFDGPHKPPSKLGSLYLNLLGTYPGSLGNYAGLQLKIPVVTVELPHAGIMPSDKEVSKIWVDLVRWLRKNIPEKKTSKVAAR